MLWRKDTGADTSSTWTGAPGVGYAHGFAQKNVSPSCRGGRDGTPSTSTAAAVSAIFALIIVPSTLWRKRWSMILPSILGSCWSGPLRGWLTLRLRRPTSTFFQWTLRGEQAR